MSLQMIFKISRILLKSLERKISRNWSNWWKLQMFSYIGNSIAWDEEDIILALTNNIKPWTFACAGNVFFFFIAHLLLGSEKLLCGARQSGNDFPPGTMLCNEVTQYNKIVLYALGSASIPDHVRGLFARTALALASHSKVALIRIENL